MNVRTPANPAQRAATLSDIAERAGVSLNTVSRVLNGQVQGKYPKARKRIERIQRIAADMNYRVNTAARATASGRFHSIGLLFRDDGSSIGSDMVFGVNSLLREHDQRLILSPIHRSGEVDDTLTIIRDLSVDGLLVSLMQDVPEAFRQTVEGFGTPVVWLNADLEQDCVRPDDRGITRAITEQLLGRGHQRIALMGRDPQASKHYSAQHRLEGYRSAMRSAGLEPVHIQTGPPGDLEARRTAIGRVLSQSPGPTAVVCGDDITAKALLYAAARRGVTIPEDLSVASVLSSHRDDMDAGIAGIELPFRNLGVAGTMMLHARIASAQPLAAQIISPVEFVEGRTVAVHASTTPG